jgi:hypothetical protein
MRKRPGEPWRCSQCGTQEVALSSERSNRAGKAHSWCRTCKAAYEKTRRGADPEKNKARMQRTRWKARGIKCTPSMYEMLLSAQGGKCAICARGPSKARQLAVDHCHSTDAIRGLLCVQCNSGIGKLGDTADAVRAALAYLEKAERI